MKDLPECQRPFIHLVGGMTSGAVAAVATCPLEVVKTRLQASTDVRLSKLGTHASITTGVSSGSMVHGETWRPPRSILNFTRFIVRTEGPLALFKGIGPTIPGITLTKGIYFGAYCYGKSCYGKIFGPNSSKTHFCAAVSGSLASTTLTSPIWVLKTRIQLDQRKRGIEMPNIFQRIVQMYQKEGLRSFYRGLSASYFGMSETAMYFVLYERLKLWSADYFDDVGPLHFLVMSATAKIMACVPFYPHEVARTRMRQAASSNGLRRYSKFLPTLRTVFVEEGLRGLYGGLGPHLMRVVPYTAIMFPTYEIVVKLLGC